MAQITNLEFKVNLKNRSKTLAGIDSAALDAMIDDALMEYSRIRPRKLIVRNIPVETDGLYSFPTGAIDLLEICANGHTVGFEVADDGTNKEYRLTGYVFTDFSALTEIPFYESQNVTQGSTARPAILEFNLTYLVVHTLATISDFDIEAIIAFIEYLAWNLKASQPEEFIELTDTDSTGASSTARADKVQASFEKQAEKKLTDFNRRMGTAYGTR